MGHSFGAPHDTAASCPPGPEGEHLMAATGSLGRRPANMALSSCSVAAMSVVLPGRRGCWRVAAGRGVALDDQLRQEFAYKNGILAYDSELDSVVESVYGNRKDHYILVRGIADYKVRKDAERISRI